MSRAATAALEAESSALESSPISTSESKSSTSSESPFERLSAFATELRSACAELETNLNKSKSAPRSRASFDVSVSARSLSEARDSIRAALRPALVA